MTMWSHWSAKLDHRDYHGVHIGTATHVIMAWLRSWMTHILGTEYNHVDVPMLIINN